VFIQFLFVYKNHFFFFVILLNLESKNQDLNGERDSHQKRYGGHSDLIKIINKMSRSSQERWTHLAVCKPAPSNRKFGLSFIF